MSNDQIVENPEIWMCHLACVSWSNPERWIQYFTSAQEILGAQLTCLDVKDPATRVVRHGRLAEAAEYACSLRRGETSRWLFGTMGEIGAQFTLRHHIEPRGWPNSLDWYFPSGFLNDESRLRAVCDLFSCGNAELSPFYAYADSQDCISRKKKPSGAVDVQAELVGIFWLSYFDSHYVAFFEKENLTRVEGAHIDINGGAMLRLGETPWAVPEGLRHDLEVKLGQTTFVDPHDILRKRPGQHALTFEQLRGQN